MILKKKIYQVCEIRRAGEHKLAATIHSPKEKTRFGVAEDTNALVKSETRIFEKMASRERKGRGRGRG